MACALQQDNKMAYIEDKPDKGRTSIVSLTSRVITPAAATLSTAASLNKTHISLRPYSCAAVMPMRTPSGKYLEKVEEEKVTSETESDARATHESGSNSFNS